ncbi:MAG: T9SS type A sorting domain-containing protein [Saprospiraceae bacterium]|nr:T9SS type A sorting domain-containing protein [Saprospiraceae bacterium]
MKNLCTLLLLIFISGLNAQIIYTENDGPKIGTKVKEEYLEDITGYDLQDFIKTGGNQDWEISGSTISDDPYEYISVNDLPFRSMFPGCNMAEQIVPNTDSSYSMYQTTTNGLYLVGSYAPGTAIVFSQPLLLVKYPLMFGDTYQNDVTATFDAGGFPAQLEMKTNTVVDAWGTMKTKKGSFPCIRVKNVQLLEFFVAGFPFGSQTFTSHSWVAKTYAQPVASLSFIEIEDNNGISSDTSISILDEQEIVANEDVLKETLSLKISPNPVTDILYVAVPETKYNEAVYSIIDAQGKALIQGKAKQGEEIVINVQQLIPGNYLVQLVLDQKTSLFDILTKP